MHLGHLIQIVAGVAATSAAVTWYFARDRRARRAIVAARVVKIGDVKEGELVRVTGRVRAGPHVLEAPFSRRTCVHYDAWIEERTLDAGNELWSTLAHATASRPFFVEDGSGVARVDTSRFEGLVAVRQEGVLAHEQALAFLREHGQAREIEAHQVVRFREGALEAGKRLTVLGTARFEVHDGEKVLVLAASEGGSVRVSDEPTLTMTVPPPPSSPSR